MKIKQFHTRETHPWYAGKENDFILKRVEVYFNDYLIPTVCGASEIEGAIDIYARDINGKVIFQRHVKDDEIVRTTIYGNVRIEVKEPTQSE